MNVDSFSYSRAKSYPILDGLRGMAAIIVVLFHVRSQFLGYVGFPAGDGYLAVDTFFLISGFVLANAYLGKFEAGMTFFEFAKIRLVRLYPLYLLGLIIGSIFFINEILRHKNLSLTTVLPVLATEIFMLPVLSEGGQLFPINNVSWSLFFEIIINIIFILVWKRLSFKVIFSLLVIFGSFLIFYILKNDTASIGNVWETFVGGFLRVGFSFFLGILIYKIRLMGGLIFEVGLVKLISFSILFVGYLVYPMQDGWRGIYDIFYIFILSPALLIVGINFEIIKKRIFFCHFLGVTSYALYCIHYPPIEGVVYLANKWNIRQEMAVNFLAIGSVVFFLFASYLLDIFYDVPVRRILNRRISTPVLLVQR